MGAEQSREIACVKAFVLEELEEICCGSIDVRQQTIGRRG